MASSPVTKLNYEPSILIFSSWQDTESPSHAKTKLELQFLLMVNEVYRDGQVFPSVNLNFKTCRLICRVDIGFQQQIYISVCTFIYVCVCVCMYVGMYVCMYVYIHRDYVMSLCSLGLPEK